MVRIGTVLFRFPNPEGPWSQAVPDAVCSGSGRPSQGASYQCRWNLRQGKWAIWWDDGSFVPGASGKRHPGQKSPYLDPASSSPASSQRHSHFGKAIWGKSHSLFSTRNLKLEKETRVSPALQASGNGIRSDPLGRAQRIILVTQRTLVRLGLDTNDWSFGHTAFLSLLWVTI